MTSDNTTDPKAKISGIMTHPKILAALQDRLSDFEGMQSSFFENLPTSMKNRVYACRNIQREYMQVESEFFNEVNQLEQVYFKRYQELYAKRTAILNGSYEPKPDECLHTDDEFEADEEKENKPKEETPILYPEETKGLPEFWSTVLRSNSTTSDLIEEYDEPILKHLNNITFIYLTSEESKTIDQTTGTIGFKLEFHFDENEYFSNEKLTKIYKLRLVPDNNSVLTYEGPEIIECIGCEINWKSVEGNVTKKVIKKKQKNRKTNEVRIIDSTVTQESFFNYFSSIQDKIDMVAANVEEMDDTPEDQEQYMREADYEIGHFIRDRLIPRAVLYYTGEVNDEEDDDESFVSDEDMDSDDEKTNINAIKDGSDEDDPDFDPKDATKPECQQQ